MTATAAKKSKMVRMPGATTCSLDPALIQCVRIESPVVVVHTQNFAVGLTPAEDQSFLELYEAVMKLANKG